MNFKQIDRKDPKILEAINQASIFKKQGQVQAREAVEGEVIVTTLESGVEETTNTAALGDWVVTNPSGEQYVISSEKFLSRYEPTDQTGVYQAKGFCRAIVNPFNGPIEIMASWGSPQTGDANCMIADTSDSEGNTDGEPYLIERDAFLKTYKAVNDQAAGQ